MLAVAIWKILGLIILGGAIGALIGLVITPFVLYLAYLIAYGIASMIVMTIPKKRTMRGRLVRFRQFANPLNDTIYDSHGKEQSISYPKHIPNSGDHGNGVVDRGIVCHPPMPEKISTAPYSAPNQNVFDSVNQETFKKAPTVFHQIVLFYRSYYGHSTKVEKNQLTQPVAHFVNMCQEELSGSLVNHSVIQWGWIPEEGLCRPRWRKTAN